MSQNKSKADTGQPPTTESVLSTPLRLLLVEDNPNDARLILHALRRAGFEPDWRRVETEKDYQANLKPELDPILGNFDLPDFDGLGALRLPRPRPLVIPWILVSGPCWED